MPVIKDYKQQIGGIGVQQRRAPGLVTTGEAAAKGTQQLAQVVGKVIEQQVGREERQNLSDLNVELTTASKELSQELVDLSKNANLNDREAFNKQFDDYGKKVKDRLSTVGEGVKGRVSAQHFAQTSASIAAQMGKGAVNAKTDLQGAIAVNQEKISASNDATTLASVPSAFKEVMARSDARIDLILDLPAAKRMEHKAQTRTRLAQASVRGWIKLDPEYAKNKIKGEIDPATGKVKGGDYAGLLSGDEQRQLLGEADQAINAKRIERERQIREVERARKSTQNEVNNSFLADMDAGKLTTKKILSENRLDSFGLGSKHQWLNMLKTHNSKKPPVTKPAAFSSAFERIHLEDGDENKITNENTLNQLYIDEKITHQDLIKLRKEVQGVGTVEGRIQSSLKKSILDEARNKLVKKGPGGLPIPDPQGESIFAQFNADFMDAYQKGRDDGKGMRELLVPGGKHYLGNIIDSYSRSMPEIMKSRRDAMQKAFEKKKNKGLLPAPKEKVNRKPGESMTDWHNRIKEKGN